MATRTQRRTTRQRVAIHAAIQGHPSHPSADEVYQEVRRVIPRISLGTVYRNLQHLVSEGKIRMVLLNGRIARYDPRVEEHDHFVCQQCGRVEDLSLKRGKRIRLASLTKEGFTITAHSLTIQGLCPKCTRKRKKLSLQTSTIP